MLSQLVRAAFDT